MCISYALLGHGPGAVLVQARGNNQVAGRELRVADVRSGKENGNKKGKKEKRRSTHLVAAHCGRAGLVIGLNDILACAPGRDCLHVVPAERRDLERVAPDVAGIKDATTDAELPGGKVGIESNTVAAIGAESVARKGGDGEENRWGGISLVGQGGVLELGKEISHNEAALGVGVANEDCVQSEIVGFNISVWSKELALDHTLPTSNPCSG